MVRGFVVSGVRGQRPKVGGIPAAGMISCCDQKGCPGIFSGVPVAKDEKMECGEQITKIGTIGNLRDSLLVICIFILLLFLFFDTCKL